MSLFSSGESKAGRGYKSQASEGCWSECSDPSRLALLDRYFLLYLFPPLKSLIPEESILCMAPCKDSDFLDCVI